MSVSAQWDSYSQRVRDESGSFPIFEKLMVMFVGEFGRVLELGCGIGMNVPFITGKQGEYHGIDCSPQAIAILRERFPGVADRVAVGDFTKEIPFESGFDLIIDRASLPHNDLAGIRRGVDLAYEYLKPGGLFIASDWFSTWHSEFTRGTKVEPASRTGYTDGQFKDVGLVHFSDEAELVDLFAKFDGIHLEERCVRRVGANRLIPNTLRFRWISRDFDDADYRSVVWDFAVKKPL